MREVIKAPLYIQNLHMDNITWHYMASHESIKTDIITNLVTLILMRMILYKDIIKCPCISCYKSSDPPKLL